jgi:DNA mismatch repair protein MutL
MAGKIKQLPEFVANQIAAGEVVNRPASVVKEMMENAVDAGARSVTVGFRDGGRTSIQVVDDGGGMTPLDARLAFDRHATSKIDTAEDIYRLCTFGFRGEALASIASVAEVALKTRQAEDELGTQVEIAGGKFVGQTPVSCPQGAQFTVKNLFYNVPARRRFLDKSSTEARHILAEYQRVVLCHPDIAFALYDGDMPLSKLPPSPLRQRIVGVVGQKIAKDLLEVSADTSIVRVEGFVGRPASARQTNREQFLFVNGRYFKSAYFNKAVVSAYEKLIAGNTQPSYFLYFTIDPERIDVNVHPQKTEVKFEDGAQVWQIVNAAVRESLARSGAVPPMDFDIDTSVEIPVYKAGATFRAPEMGGNPDFNPFEKYGEVENERAPRVSDWEEDDYERSTLEFIDGGEQSQMRLEVETEGVATGAAVQLGTRYAVMAAEGGLLAVDLRRAHEAVLYARYEAILAGGNSVSQQLLFPEHIALSTDDATLLREHLGDFAAFGFDIAMRDEHTATVAGLPADLSSDAPEAMIYQLLDSLRDEGTTGERLRRERLAAAMARMGAAAGRAFTPQETAALLASFEAAGMPAFTHAGCATTTLITEDEIAKRMR